MEIVGIGIAFSLTMFSLFILIQITIFFFVQDVREAYFLPVKESFQGMGEYCRLALPLSILWLVYFAPWELCIFTAGLINKHE